MNPSFPAPAAAHLARAVRRLRRRYRKRLERCQREFSEEAVHALRIETRRLLALLDLLRALHFPNRIRQIRKVLKRRLDAFDPLRDVHVCLLLLKPFRREFPEARELELLWRHREEELIRRLRHEVKVTRQARLEKRIKALEKALRQDGMEKGPDAVEDLVLAAVREAYAVVLTRRRRIRRRDAATIHRTRVAFKRFRYMCELLRPLLPGVTKELLNRMRDFQTCMGDIQDVEVLLAALQSAAAKEEVSPDAVRGAEAELRRRRLYLIKDFLVITNELTHFDPARFGSQIPEESSHDEALHSAPRRSRGPR